MTLATLGWSVVHAVWIGTALGGAIALALAMIPDRRARLRYILAGTCLMWMVVAPLVMAIGTLDFFTPSIRRQVTEVVEATVGLSAVVEWRARVVNGAAVLWLAGVAYCLIRVGLEWRRLRHLRRVGLGDADGATHDLVAALAAELRLQTPVTIVRSNRVAVPMVFGWRHPRLLLPSGATTDLDPKQLRAVLAHELAHVRRLDYPANLLQVGAETVLWFHPAARWVSRRVRPEREYCCDDIAIGVGGDAVHYAHALVALDEARDNCRLAVAAASGTLLDRIQRIVGQPRPVMSPGRAVLALAGAVVVASTIVVLTMVVPPRMPLDVRLRSRSPAPAGTTLPAAGLSLPRTPQR